MWYFAWILGLGLAAAFGILNAMWYELHLQEQGDSGETGDTAPPDTPRPSR
jgi:cyd operon protein YbgT